jgi:ubiquinone/menaquinone biosynthesis C-methylase UbiE
MSAITSFTGSIPANYDRYLGPILFETYALDLAERVKSKKLDNVLELACGTGRLTRHLSKLVPENGHYIATDLNPDMMAVAQSKIADKKIEWRVANAQDLPFENNSFDLVVCQFGVMLFAEKEKAFAQVFRVLKPQGAFVFSVWDDIKYSPKVALVNKVMQDVTGANPADFLTKGPHSFYNKSEIRNLLMEAGFTNIQIEEVQKTVTLENPEDLFKGFTEGSPLRLYIEEQEPSLQQTIKDRLQKEFTAAYESNREMPMQALVCEATK